MNTYILSARDAVTRLWKEQPLMRNDAWFGILFCGDRLSCCDEAAIIEINGNVVALATISPVGEMGEGMPTIVGFYTVREYRKQGCGREALVAAIRRCAERGFKKIRIDVLAQRVLGVIASLPADLSALLEVHRSEVLLDFLE